MNEEKGILRLNLAKIEQSLIHVEENWKKIDDELDLKKIGRKDTFNADIRTKMMSAYEVARSIYLEKALNHSQERVLKKCVN